MKKNYKKLILLFGVALVVGLAFRAFGLADDGYELRIGLDNKIIQKEDQLLPSERKIAYFKLDETKMGPWDFMRLSKEAESLTLKEIEEKLGQKASISENSKLFFDGKFYDKMTSAMYEKNKDQVREKVSIKNLEEGTYLLKVLGGDKNPGKSIVEYIGKEASENNIVELELK